MIVFRKNVNTFCINKVYFHLQVQSGMRCVTHPLQYWLCMLGPLQRVSEGALSPDGTVLATASHDGYIKFWQIYIEGVQDKPRYARTLLLSDFILTCKMLRRIFRKKLKH